MLEALLQTGRRWWIRQSYPRGCEPGCKAGFLFKSYLEDDKTTLLKHQAHIQQDQYHKIYDAQQPHDRQLLQIAASQPQGYKVYYAGKKGANWSPPALYENLIKSYIRQHHPHWRPHGKKEQIQVGLVEEFGTLFLKLEFENETDQIPLNKIEY